MTRDTLLAIFQQSEYDVPKLREWAEEHKNDADEIKPEKWSGKLKLISFLSRCFFWASPLTAIEYGLAIVTPFENTLRWFIYTAAWYRLTWFRLRGLKVVAVAGSFAKTSTKTILSETLSPQIPTLMTPLSYNTKLGIAQIIRQKLTSKHKLFIVEFGEYHVHDIPELVQYLKPDWGILTPLGRQHLEVLGGFDKIIKTFSTFIAFFDKKPTRLLVAEQNKVHYPNQNLTFYGLADSASFRVFNVSVSRAGTEYEVMDRVHNQTYHIFTPLFGGHQATNTLPALWLAHELKLDVVGVIKKIRTLPYVYRRHEPTFAERNVLILDNSYNTNPDSAPESLKLLNQLDASRRLVITLGFTELGKESATIHHDLGQKLAKQADYVGLIEAPWSDDIIKGFVAGGGAKSHIVVGKTQEEALQKLQEYIIPSSVILFEGGFREVYV